MTRAALHQLIDQLPESALDTTAARRVLERGSDQEVSDSADERSEGCIAKRKRRVTSSVRRRFSKT